MSVTNRIIAWSVALLLCLSCESEENVYEPVEETPEVVDYDAFIRHFSDSLPEYFEKATRGELKPRSYESLIRAEESGIKHRNILSEFYKDGRKAVFITREGLSELGKVVMRVLENSQDEGLDVDDYHVSELRRILDGGESDDFDGIFLSEYEKTALRRHIEEKKWKSSESFRLFTDLTRDPESSFLPRLACALTLYKQSATCGEERIKVAELLLADGLLRYAEEMRLGNLRRLSETEARKYTTEENPQVHPRYREEIVSARLKDFLTSIHAKNIDKQLQALIPEHPQYAKLKEARARYGEIVKAGGWQKIRAERMFKGGQAPKVRMLKERLTAEGLYAGEIDEIYGKDLVEAVERYQHLHQLDITGEPNDVFWRSLNVSAEQRLAEINENIRLWHRSLYEKTDSYLYVNIPSFTAEYRRNGELMATHRVVVGASTKYCNPKTREWEYMNATPILRSRLNTLVLNPFWNVTPRIEIDEYWPKIQANPKWLEENGFEYHNPRSGGRVLRQKPGPNNALGRVKLLFPNRHGVYLHDTPNKDVFKYTIRAFSHGCVRVDGALKLARKILEADGQWEEINLNKIFKRKTEQPIMLKQPLDVFFEYHTVTVGEEDEIYFLADIYKLVRDEISPPDLKDLACDPAKHKVSSYRAGTFDAGP